jgi:hypothetical protein
LFIELITKNFVEKEVISLSRIMRIGVGMLIPGEQFGSIELPERAEDLCCPQCGTLLGDRGQCSAQFLECPSGPGMNALNVLRAIVDCRSCGCVDKELMFRKTWEFSHPDRI